MQPPTDIDIDAQLLDFQKSLSSPYATIVCPPSSEEICEDVSNFLRNGPYRKICLLFSDSGDYEYDPEMDLETEHEIMAECIATYKQALIFAKSLFGESCARFPPDWSTVYCPDAEDFPEKENAYFDGIPWTIEYEGGPIFQNNDSYEHSCYWEHGNDHIVLQLGKWSGDGNFNYFVAIVASPKLARPSTSERSTTRPALKRKQTPAAIAALEDALGSQLKKVSATNVMDYFHGNSYSLNRQHEITGLHLRNHQLTHLRHLKPFTSLQRLCVTDNAIASLTDITHLKDLKELILSNNLLQSLDGIENFPHLQKLIVNGNKLTSLAKLGATRQLKSLYAGANQLQDIQVLRCLPRLTELGLFCNRITDIAALTHLKKLQRLDISENKLVDLTPLLALSVLNQLSISDNPATKGMKLANFENHLDLVLKTLASH